MTSHLQLPPLRRPLGVMALAGHLVLFGALASAQGAGTGKPAAPETKTAALSNLLYVPHDFNAPVVTDSGGVRGMETSEPDLVVLAPPKLARSLSAQPTLYWYASGPSSAPVRLTLQGLEETKPLLEVDLGPVPAKGVYATSLAERGVRLAPDALYEWSVALEVNPAAYSEETVARTILQATGADPAVRAKLEGAAPLAQVRTLAENGYWYDALDLLSAPDAAGDLAQRELRAALLDQVGLQEVAAFERAQ